MKLTKKWTQEATPEGYSIPASFDAYCGDLRLVCASYDWRPGWWYPRVRLPGMTQSRTGAMSRSLRVAQRRAEELAETFLADFVAGFNRVCADCGIEPVED